MSVHRALPVNHTLKGYHPNLQGPLPTHQSSRTRPGHWLISHALLLVTWDVHKLQPLPHFFSPYIHTNIHTLCWKHSITYSKVWVWLCFSKFCHCLDYSVKAKATEACFVTLAALSWWIFILLFIAVMFLCSCYRAVFCFTQVRLWVYSQIKALTNIKHYTAVVLFWLFMFNVWITFEYILVWKTYSLLLNCTDLVPNFSWKT